MEVTVFYSWQSDLPNNTNRGFIEQALLRAAKAIHTDQTIKIEPVIDRDTIGVPGSPDIADTIFSKIDNSHILVCDVSIINSGDKGRPTPNPNVLIELGYALKVLGTSRIIMVLNQSYGDAELLPFDLRMRRVITYNSSKESENRPRERKRLQAIFETALRAVFESDDFFTEDFREPELLEQARLAVEGTSPNQLIIVRQFMSWLTNEIMLRAPNYDGAEEHDELLLAALNNTKDLSLDFSRLSSSISAMNAVEAALELFKGFSSILEKYNLPRGFSGHFDKRDFDYYKFMGHELYVSLIALLIRDSRWDMLSRLLDTSIYVDNKRVGSPGIVYFDYISDYLPSLNYRNQRLKLGRASIHADVLNEWHTEGELANIVPMNEFVGADFFLFLRASLKWRPWSTIYLGSHAPRFLIEASSKTYVQNLLGPLRIENEEQLKTTIIERVKDLMQMFRSSLGFYPLEDFDLNSIGTLQ